MSRIEGGGYLDSTIGGRPEIVSHGNGTICHVIEHVVNGIIGVGELFIVGKADENRDIVERAMVRDVVAGFDLLFGLFPRLSPCHPFLWRDKGIGSQAFTGRVLPACNKLGGNQFAILFFCIDKISCFWMPHDGKTIGIMKIVEILVA